MAPTAPPASGSNSNNISKDAMYLFELLRESPQPILIHIGPYAAKTGAKPNTIIKRLGEIKKRNGLNIITTTAPPGGAAGQHYVGVGVGVGGGETKPKVKRERAPKVNMDAKVTSTEKMNAKPAQKLKFEATDRADVGIPSPADSTAGAEVGSANATALLNGRPGVVHGMVMGTIPSYMAQKRSMHDAFEERDSQQNQLCKKLKTEETWNFS